MTEINPQAKPFCLSGSTEKALLMLHGFTASPSEVYPVARLVHEQSCCTVSGILLPGHGSDPARMNQCRWQDWYGAVRTELTELRQSYEKVFVGGLSMGGLLALNAALDMEGLQGVISINAPIYYRNPCMTWMAPLYGKLNPFYPKKETEEMKQLEQAGRFAYRVMPVEAFQELMRLRTRVMREIHKIKIPALIMQALKDDAVHPRSGKCLFAHTRAQHSILLELKASSHIATMGPEKEQVAAGIAAFMEKSSQAQ